MFGPVSLNPPAEDMMHRHWTALIKPRKLKFAEAGNAQHKASLVLEPLERGFGTTLGNALRRVLLSSMHGAAISSVKIAGVSHGTIPGVVEDVIDILLNLKGVVIRMGSGAAQTMTLNTGKAGAVTAGDIGCGRDIQILNPNHQIATIEKGGSLDMVLTVTTGKGYVRARPESDRQSIEIDCSYNPVKNVSYKVSNARVGQQTDYDRLLFDIETNGVISPMKAMEIAARILKNQLNVFINFAEQATLDDVVVETVTSWDMNLFRRVENLELSIRAANCIKGIEIVYVGDLVRISESQLLKTPNFGRKSLEEIKAVLGEMGLSLGMHLDGWPPDNIKELAKQIDDENFI